jgi:ribulose-phosphate 3-epimerase
MKYKIIPAILEYSEPDIIKRIEEAKRFADHLHIDIIDESFSQQTILPSPALFAPYSVELFLELHMMVKDPKRLVEPFLKAGFKRFLGHVEDMENQKSFIEAVTKSGGEAFLAFDLETPLKNLDAILTAPGQGLTLMSIHAGKAGQSFDPRVLEKIQEAREKFPDTDIQVDGGINPQTLQDALASGANLFDVNTALFKTLDPAATYQSLCHQLK